MDANLKANRLITKKEQQHFFILADAKLQNLDIGEELLEVLDNLSIGYKFSDRTFDNTLVWISAKGSEPRKVEYESEVCMVYYNAATFEKDYLEGKVRKDLKMIKSFYPHKGTKTLVVLQSVGDSLLNNPDITSKMYQEFLVELTVAFEFDFIELKNMEEFFTLVNNIQECLEKKSGRKEFLMEGTYIAAKGAKYSKKAYCEGFEDIFSKYWIGMIMSIPGVSEAKAIAIAKKYPNFKNLVKEYNRKDIPESEKKLILCKIEVPSQYGEGKTQKIGKKISEKIYECFSCTDPKMQIE
ncbi:unnamed protein product [Moneuplotes crassus]|uniref:ERCC4 domain-containing protein n=1 Tax=Euplotes crassus TaxID=5936 RepID=A0AAD2D1V6_EUPCR|nr:unnamed protein product [Moneuplotes crassus]